MVFHVSGLRRELFHAVLKEYVISEISFTKILFSFLVREAWKRLEMWEYLPDEISCSAEERAIVCAGFGLIFFLNWEFSDFMRF